MAIADAEKPVSLGQLAAMTGLYKSTILRLAASLQGAGLIMRQTSGEYLLGPAALSLGARFQKQAVAAEFMLPLMRDLATASGESVAFYVPFGQSRLCLYRIDSSQPLRFTVEVGAQLTLEQGSGGRILSAYLGNDDPLYATIRQNGHYYSDGERDPNVAGVSVPVFRPRGEIAGALTLAGPRLRLTRNRAADMLPNLRAAAARATSILAGAGP